VVFLQYSRKLKILLIKSKSPLLVLMWPFPVFSTRQRGKREWKEFQEEVEEKGGKK
jgi:hypothetical protein